MPQTNIYPQVSKTDSEHKSELYAVCASLSVLGIAFSTWASRVPDVRDAAVLTAATLGYVLLVRGTGTITMMPVVAMSINNLGARKTTLIMGIIVVLSLVPIAFVTNWIALSVVLFVVGAGSSSYNIAVNALGSKVETETGKSHMSKIHSWFGIGNLSGALLGTLATRFAVSTKIHFSIISVICLVIILSAYRFLPRDEPHPGAERPKFKWPHGGLIAIGIICFLASAIEGSINNWVALFFSDHVQVKEGFAPVGYTVFAGSLLMMRLIGDRLKTRFGARTLLMAGPSTAAVGLLIAVFAPGVVLAGAGMFLAGAGVALTFPMIFSAAGREGAIALTSVATFGYVGGMISQPVMGWIVTEFKLAGGFIFIALAALSVSILASRARLLRG